MINTNDALSTILDQRLSMLSWAGGRGKIGPLGVWLLVQQELVIAARERRPGATWSDVAAAAAVGGVRRQNGKSYNADAVRTTWHRLMTTKRCAPHSTVVPPTPAGRPGEPDRLQVRENTTSASMPPIRRFGDVI